MKSTLLRERGTELHRLLSAKTVSFLPSVCLLMNAMTGPSIPFTAGLFQTGGGLPTVLGFILFAILSSFCCLFIIEAMQAIPGNKHFQVHTHTNTFTCDCFSLLLITLHMHTRHVGHGWIRYLDPFLLWKHFSHYRSSVFIWSHWIQRHSIHHHFFSTTWQYPRWHLPYYMWRCIQ